MSPISNLESSRTPIAALPTPLEVAGQLSAGGRLLIKRDDLTGLGMGGNKARKLEMLCHDAGRKSADMLVTVGAPQSNHARVTAAAGARMGWETHIVLGGSAETKHEGNQLLSTLFGATIHNTGTDSWPELELAMNVLVTDWTEAGRRPYAIPMGGSTSVGALGFVLGWSELLFQMDERSLNPAAVVVASSTGGTHAGMLAGRAIYGGPPILAIDVAKSENDLRAATLDLANEVLSSLGTATRVDKSDVELVRGFAGPGYAVPTEEADNAMRALAQSGGWVLDRVYTAKAFGALLSFNERNVFGADDVVFWHTGGQPAVFSVGGAPGQGVPEAILSYESESE